MTILLVLTLTVLAGAVGGLGILDLVHARVVLSLQAVQMATRHEGGTRE